MRVIRFRRKSDWQGRTGLTVLCFCDYLVKVKVWVLR